MSIPKNDIVARHGDSRFNQYSIMIFGDEEALIYHEDNQEAWIQSSAAVEIAEHR